jgi:hypothetical protein
VKSDSSFCWMLAGVGAVCAIRKKQGSRRAAATERETKARRIMASFLTTTVFGVPGPKYLGEFGEE